MRFPKIFVKMRGAVLLISVALLSIQTAIEAEVAAKPAPSEWIIASPDARNRLAVSLNGEGELRYQVKRGRRVVIQDSPLGLRRNDETFERGLTFVQAGKAEIERQTYELLTGNRTHVDSKMARRSVTFRNPNGAMVILDLAASDEGVAFRYRFPEQSPETRVMEAEQTGFALPRDAKGWLQPYHVAGQYTPAYEDYYYSVSPGEAPPRARSAAIGWGFPALFHVPSAEAWVLLTESGTDAHYAACHLTTGVPDGLYRIAFPAADESTQRVPKPFGPEPRSTLPWTMPWRVIIVGRTAADLAMSTLVTDLAAPSRIADLSWIKPGRTSWSWWGYPEGPHTVERYAQFTDLAADMGWEYTLFDGGWWEAGLEPIARYARSKGVTGLAWSFAGDFYDADKRRRKLDELANGGARGVKADFWCSDRQEAIAAMHGLFEAAAERRMVVNLHGGTLPRGWHRTWPNFLTAEAVLGTESYFYEPTYPDRVAELNCLLPFTRNVAGPMDYTPVACSPKKFARQTTAAHELATALVFTSGIVCYADKPEFFDTLPPAAKEIMRDAPARWDESRCLVGEPGRLVVFARRTWNTWFIAGLNGTKTALPVNLNLKAFRGFKHGTLITEGADPLMQVRAEALTPSLRWRHELPGQGGFILRLDK